jgi:hypothetical protein
LLIYKKIIEHVTFTLITTNHYFSENPEKARAARLKEAEEVLQITPTFGFDPPTKVVGFASGCAWSFGTVLYHIFPHSPLKEGSSQIRLSIPNAT